MPNQDTEGQDNGFPNDPPINLPQKPGDFKRDKKNIFPIIVFVIIVVAIASNYLG